MSLEFPECHDSLYRRESDPKNEDQTLPPARPTWLQSVNPQTPSNQRQRAAPSTPAFKDGTALKTCDLGDYHFSEDLDFSAMEDAPMGAAMERAIQESCQAAVEIVCERYVKTEPHPGGQEAFTIRSLATTTISGGSLEPTATGLRLPGSRPSSARSARRETSGLRAQRTPFKIRCSHTSKRRGSSGSAGWFPGCRSLRP
jgi:hypothetical protein